MRGKREKRCVVIGAGPAGLTAAYELARLRIPARVVEMGDTVGGIAQTVKCNGYRFDLGGHRFFTKSKEVQRVWTELLAGDLLTRPRLSRIYYRGKFFDYPLKPLNVLSGLGVWETMRIGLSYLKAQVGPTGEARDFEHWVCNRFGRRLYETFFKAYTEKVWGVPCTEISAEWAAQRIMNLDLGTAVRNALLGGQRHNGTVVTTLIDKFQYPRLGPGMMWERCRALLESKGYPTVTGRRVVSIRRNGERIVGLTLRDRQGREYEESGTDFISSMPIRELVAVLDPPAPPAVRAAAKRLRYRDFLTVVLVVDRADVFPDNWIYIHSPDLRVGRIQNFKNWSPDMVPDSSKTVLGMEYFVEVGDDLWAASDESLIALGRQECAAVGLIDEREVEDGTVVRMPKAYPVYDHHYKEALATIRESLDRIENLQTIGRNGLHRYNNQDHSMLTGMYAARNLAGGCYDVWSVNVEEEYHEQVGARGDANIPASVPSFANRELIQSVFARYDPVALGTSIGSVLGAGVFMATAALLLNGGDPMGPTLSLLGNYFFGYEVTWAGAVVGLVEGVVAGFLFGSSLACLINRVTRWHGRVLLRRISGAKVLE